jgi:ribose transport system ATP-binding protein
VATYDEALAAGVAYVPSNRRRDGGWISGTAKENISLPVLQTLAKRGWINAQRERDLAAKVMARTQVRPLEPEKLFGSFSGGNQQKIVVGKWLQRAPRVLLLHEPTQGVDVGARRDLLQLVSETAQSGSAVLVSSNDFDQLAEICQRVIVLYDGRVVDELVGDLVSEGDIAKSAQRIKDHH